jgi:hypothetical protein
MKKTEIIIATLAIIALVLNLMLIPGSGMLTVLSFSILAVIYFYFGLVIFNDVTVKEVLKIRSISELIALRNIGAVATGAALALTIIGLMFKIQLWPGANINLSIGLFGLAVVTILGAIKYSKSKSNYYTKIFSRVAIIGGLGLIVFLLPKTSLVEFQYRNHPAYVEAYKKAMADPNNKELWDNVQAERQKMYENAAVE